MHPHACDVLFAPARLVQEVWYAYLTLFSFNVLKSHPSFEDPIQVPLLVSYQWLFQPSLMYYFS